MKTPFRKNRVSRLLTTSLAVFAITLASCSSTFNSTQNQTTSLSIPDYDFNSALSKITQSALFRQISDDYNDYDGVLISPTLSGLSVKQNSNSPIKINETLIYWFKQNYLINTNLHVDASKLEFQNPEIDWSKFSFVIDADDSYQAPNDSTTLNVAVVIIYKIDEQRTLRRKVIVPFSGFKASDNQTFITEANKWIDAFSVTAKATTGPAAFLKSQYDASTDKMKWIADHFNLPTNQDHMQNKFRVKVRGYDLEYRNFTTLSLITEFVATSWKNNEPTATAKPQSQASFYSKYQYVFSTKKKFNFTYNQPTSTDETQKTTEYHDAYKKYLEATTKVSFQNFLNPQKFDFSQTIQPNYLRVDSEDLATNLSGDNQKVVQIEITKVEPNPDWKRSVIVDLTASLKGLNADQPNQMTTINFQKVFGVKKHGYIYSPTLQDNTNNAHLYVPNLQQQDLTLIPPGITEQFGAGILTGGYGENRKFYSSREYNYVHFGEDVLAPPLTPVYAPFNGKIIAAFYAPTPNEAEGIGTTVVLEVDRKDLTLDPGILNNELKGVQKVYIGLIHLERTTLNLLADNPGDVIDQAQTGSTSQRNITYVKSIYPQSPKTVKQGQQIGYVGEINDNGGWAPHTHVAVINGTTTDNTFTDVNGFKLQASSSARMSTERLYGTSRRQYYNTTTKKFDYSIATVPGVGLLIGSSWSWLTKVGPDSVPLDDTTAPKKAPKTKQFYLENDKKVAFSGYLRRFYGDQYLAKEELLASNLLLNPNLFFGFRNPNSQVMVLNDLIPAISQAENIPQIDLTKQVVQSTK